MADINATDLTQETASTMDGNEQIIMFDSAEGKRATVKAVGDYIIQQVTSNLNGANQTLAAALSALNSNLTGHFKKITSGSVHDVTENGIYYVTTGATDKPSNIGGLMIVCYYTPAYHIRLFIENAANPKWYIYRHNGSQAVIDWEVMLQTNQ